MIHRCFALSICNCKHNNGALTRSYSQIGPPTLKETNELLYSEEYLKIVTHSFQSYTTRTQASQTPTTVWPPCLNLKLFEKQSTYRIAELKHPHRLQSKMRAQPQATRQGRIGSSIPADASLAERQPMAPNTQLEQPSPQPRTEALVDDTAM